MSISTFDKIFNSDDALMKSFAMEIGRQYWTNKTISEISKNYNISRGRIERMAHAATMYFEQSDDYEKKALEFDKRLQRKLCSVPKACRWNGYTCNAWICGNNGDVKKENYNLTRYFLKK